MIRSNLADLLRLLELETIDLNRYRGASLAETRHRVYGGQVLAQGLVAAQRTVSERSAHSLHAYFIRPGDSEIPILFEVDRIRDGRSFTTRRIKAVQRGEAIFSMDVSFQIEETGFEHQSRIPDVPGPDELPTEEARARRATAENPERFTHWDYRATPFEVRYVEDLWDDKPHPPRHHVWFRTRESLPDDPALHQAIALYYSDDTIMDNAIIPHGGRFVWDRFMSASLDHAMWFHHAFRVDEWHLFAQDSPAAFGARGLTRGEIFSRDGKLVASVAQEALMRPLETHG
jgi:acyl-CoA thioesterase-2